MCVKTQNTIAVNVAFFSGRHICSKTSWKEYDVLDVLQQCIDFLYDVKKCEKLSVDREKFSDVLYSYFQSDSSQKKVCASTE